jgi:anti-sigma B factor antagonist
MGLNAQIRTDALGNITIYMNGDLSYDYNARLKKEIIDISNQHPHSIITLDMHSLDFVGSSGISKFVELLKDLKKKNSSKYKLSNIKSEFLKVFEIYNFNAYEMLTQEYESDETNMQSLTQRGKTFPN